MSIDELNDAKRHTNLGTFRLNTRVYELWVNTNTERLTIEFTAQNEKYPDRVKWTKIGNTKSCKVIKN